jgi:type II secretory pathway pseudopilin PulG
MLQNPNGSKNTNKFLRGVSIIEILLVIAIIGISLISLLSLTTLSLKASVIIRETTEANHLAQEALEATRNFRDGINWNNDDPENKYDGLGIVSTGVAYHLEKSTDTPPRWMLIQGEEQINDFTRKVVFNDTYRNSLTYDIATDGDYLDSNTKKVTVTVSWQNRRIEIVSYLTNW